MSKQGTGSNASYFESTGESAVFGRVYDDMLMAPAFKDLSSKQKLLYMYCKVQPFKRSNPQKKYEKCHYEWLQGDGFFFLSLPTVVNYGLYASGGRTHFYNDMKALENHGFIKKVCSGKAAKKENIYRLSADWKKWPKI